MSTAPMDKVTSWLWVGDQRAGFDWQTLDHEGITAVFNATPTTDNWPADMKARVPYLRMNQDDGAPIPLAKLDAYADWFLKCRAAGKRLLVHCAAGVSRASTFAIFSLILESGWSQVQHATDPVQRRLEASEAWDKYEFLVRQRREQIQPHPYLKQSVMEWLTR